MGEDVFAEDVFPGAVGISGFSRKLWVGVLGIRGELRGKWGEGKRVGAEFVIGDSGRECFDDPEGGCAGLGGDFADERDADGGGAVAEGTPGWYEVVAEDGKKAR